MVYVIMIPLALGLWFIITVIIGRLAEAVTIRQYRDELGIHEYGRAPQIETPHSSEEAAAILNGSAMEQLLRYLRIQNKSRMVITLWALPVLCAVLVGLIYLFVPDLRGEWRVLLVAIAMLIPSTLACLGEHYTIGKKLDRLRGDGMRKLRQENNMQIVYDAVESYNQIMRTVYHV